MTAQLPRRLAQTYRRFKMQRSFPSSGEETAHPDDDTPETRTAARVCAAVSLRRSFDLPKDEDDDDDKMSNDLWGALRVTLDSTWLNRPTKGKAPLQATY